MNQTEALTRGRKLLDTLLRLRRERPESSELRALHAKSAALLGALRKEGASEDLTGTLLRLEAEALRRSKM